MKKISILVLMFVFGLLSMPQNVYAQDTQSNSELGIFLKTKGYTPIKLNKFPTGHLYLTTEVNNTAATFILDTGAGATVIDKKKNEVKLKLEASESENKAVGAGGSSISLNESLIKDFKIQDYTINDLKVHLMPLDHINNAFKQMGIEEVDGVIGADILTTGKAIIDYANLILYLK